ncbi:hypothetical protein Tco_0132117 [Tanacetum coccineum]
MRMYYAAWEMLYEAKYRLSLYGSRHVLTCKPLGDGLDSWKSHGFAAALVVLITGISQSRQHVIEGWSRLPPFKYQLTRSEKVDRNACNLCEIKRFLIAVEVTAANMEVTTAGEDCRKYSKSLLLLE